MKKLLFFSLSLVVLTLTSSFKSFSDNYLKIGINQWDLTSAIIANESYGSKSKFELDILSNSTQISTAETYIYFTVTSSATTQLTDGIYYASSANLQERTPFRFNGWVQVNGQKIDITDGSFSIQNQDGIAEIHFVLQLENGDVANGSYTGKFSSVDRSSNYN